MWKQVHFQLFTDQPDDIHERLRDLEDRLRTTPGVADAEAAKGTWEIDVRYDPDRLSLDELAAQIRDLGLLVVPDEGVPPSGRERPYKDFDEDAIYKEPRE